MLKIWGRKNSSNVQKVMWAVGETGVAHEHTDLGGAFGGNREASFLALNPNGLVPAMQDGDVVLWESNAIVRYIASKYGAGRLAPSDPAMRARADQWMDWQQTTVNAPMVTTFWGLIRTPEDKRDHAAIAAGQARYTEVMTILDVQLAKTPYVAGDTFCMGDIPLAIMAHRYLYLFPDHPPLPNLQRWYDALAVRKAFQDHVAAIPMT
ncbi:MAG: glutathione S-transferase [Alphaproteobacteria bacterium]|jgi:glutathione S-transferase|nr:glutathione S-transferase [Alphaproteobacteria bacterium]